MPKQNPEWVKCIKHTHAAYATMSGARQVPCPDCIIAIIKALKDD